MLSKLHKSNKGFTIIEVMIVLAIAGLIILIVLLAIPALQRNGRNTAIKNDSSAIAGAISTFQSDNDGAAPTGISSNGNVTGAAGTVSAQAKIQGGTTVTTVTAVPTAIVPHGTIQFWLAHRCDGTSSTRSTAIFYSIETSGTESVAGNNKCIDA